MRTEAERLAALRATGLLDSAPEPDFDDLAQLASRVAGTALSAISLVDEARLYFKARVGTALSEMPRAGSFCTVAIEHDGPLVVPDARVDPRFAESPVVAGPPHARFYAGFPLAVAEGHVLGTLCVFDLAPRNLDDGQRASLAAIGRQVVRLVAARRQTQDVARIVASLAESEARFRSAFEAGAGGLVFVALDGRFLRANGAFAEMVGYTPEEVTRLTIWDVTHPDEREATAQRFRRVRDPDSRTMTFQRRFVRKDGTIVWAQGAVRLVQDAQGAPLHYISLYQDISALKELGRMKDEFVSTVSHEIRTPLTSIRGALGLLEGGVLGDLPAEAREVVGVALESCKRLVRLVNDVLDVEKMEAGMLTLRERDVPAAELVATAFEGVRTVADQAGVALVAEVADDAVLSVDADRIVQVLLNLVSNAVRFSPPGGAVTVRVRWIGGDDADAHVRVSVHDGGPGIPPDRMPELFGKFSQIDAGDARARAGSGLGLAICKAIVEQHGGHIGVDSHVGEGSVFYFDLDARRAPTTGPDAEAAPPSRSAATDASVAEALAELRAEYRPTLPDRAAEVLAALERLRAQPGDPASHAEATTRAHSLGGTAGSYGFAEVGAIARRIEDDLPRVRSDDAGEREAAWRAIDTAARELARAAARA